MSEPTGFPIELTREEYVQFLLVIGYAVGAADEKNDRGMFGMALTVANAVSRNNPTWEKYKVEEGLAQ